MTRRSAQASFVPGGYVFPGGGLEAQDAQEGLPVLARPAMPAAQRQAAIAAVRETFEEMGLLLAVHADGRPATQADVDALDRSASLWPQLLARACNWTCAGVWLLAHWTARPCVPKRFAVPFFDCSGPAGANRPWPKSERTVRAGLGRAPASVAAACGWAHAHDLSHLAHLGALGGLPRDGSAAGGRANGPAVAQHAAFGPSGRQGIPLHGKRSGLWRTGLALPDGQAQPVLDWQSTQVVALRKNVLRLTAPNEGVMTGPGTNSYLIGEAATGFIAIDPGPAMPSTLSGCWWPQAQIFAPLCVPIRTPTMPLGRGCCRPCARRKPGSNPRCMACPAGGDPAHSHFVPDQVLQNKELLTLAGKGENAKITHTLQALHTPGHASNHLCLLLVEDGLLFRGITSSMAAPPSSIRPMAIWPSTCKAWRIWMRCVPSTRCSSSCRPMATCWGQARQVIAQLTAHRLAREAKVLAAMRQVPRGTPTDWVALAYADTPRPYGRWHEEACWPMQSALRHWDCFNLRP